MTSVPAPRPIQTPVMPKPRDLAERKSERSADGPVPDQHVEHRRPGILAPPQQSGCGQAGVGDELDQAEQDQQARARCRRRRAWPAGVVEEDGGERARAAGEQQADRRAEHQREREAAGDDRPGGARVAEALGARKANHGRLQQRGRDGVGDARRPQRQRMRGDVRRAERRGVEGCAEEDADLGDGRDADRQADPQHRDKVAPVEPDRGRGAACELPRGGRRWPAGPGSPWRRAATPSPAPVGPKAGTGPTPSIST